MSHTTYSPIPSQGGTINANIFDSKNSQNIDDTNSTDNDWMDKYFAEEHPYGSGVHSQGSSFPSVPPSGTSLLPNKRKRPNESFHSTSKPKSRRISQSLSGVPALYIPDISFEPTKPAATNTPLTGTNVLFPDPDQFSGIISGKNALPDELNDTIFSPMPPMFDHLEQIWDQQQNHNELSSPVSEKGPSVTQSAQGVPAHLEGAEQRTEQVVPPPSIDHVKHTAVRPSDEVGALESTTPLPTPASNKTQVETDSSPRKNQYIIASANPEDVLDKDAGEKKGTKRKRAGSLKPSRKEDQLPQQESWLEEENEEIDEDSFIVDDTADASGPPKKKRRKNRKLTPKEGFNSGAWSNAEHQRFLEGLRKYGRSKWREISDFVGTRSRIQVASHSQKYFAKIDAQEDVQPAAEVEKMSRAKSRGKKSKKE